MFKTCHASFLASSTLWLVPAAAGLHVQWTPCASLAANNTERSEAGTCTLFPTSATARTTSVTWNVEFATSKWSTAAAATVVLARMDFQGCQESSRKSIVVAELCDEDEVYRANLSQSSEATRQDFTQATEQLPPFKRQRLTNDNCSSLPIRTAASSRLPSSAGHLGTLSQGDTATSNMSDGSTSKRSFKGSSKAWAHANGEPENEARALRVLEIMNDFRTLQVHITSLVTRAEASPPDQASYYLDGYVVIRQCSAEAQAILATHYNPGNLGVEPGNIPGTEVQKATLQRILLDSSTRRFSVSAPTMMIGSRSLTLRQAHKIYLRAAAGMRWIQLRQQASSGSLSPDKKAQVLRALDTRIRQVCAIFVPGDDRRDRHDQHLHTWKDLLHTSIRHRSALHILTSSQELSNITDESVVNDLRDADRRKNYWVDEDPTLERMLAWIRRQG